MRIAMLYLVTLGLVACTSQAPPDEKRTNDAAVRRPTAGQGNDQLSHPPVPPPAPSALPGLIPLSDAAIRQELAPGASCALIERGNALLVATSLEALVNDGGRLIHLNAEAGGGESLARGGRFLTRDLIVEIRAGPVRAQRGERIERDTDVSITRGNRGFKTFHGPSWVCGS